MLGSKSNRNMHESAHQTIFCGTPCASVICKQCGFGGSLKVPSVSVQNEANLSSLNPPVVFGGGCYLSCHFVVTLLEMRVQAHKTSQDCFQCLIQPLQCAVPQSLH